MLLAYVCICITYICVHVYRYMNIDAMCIRGRITCNEDNNIGYPPQFQTSHHFAVLGYLQFTLTKLLKGDERLRVRSSRWLCSSLGSALFYSFIYFLISLMSSPARCAKALGHVLEILWLANQKPALFS